MWRKELLRDIIIFEDNKDEITANKIKTKDKTTILFSNILLLPLIIKNKIVSKTTERSAKNLLNIMVIGKDRIKKEPIS